MRTKPLILLLCMTLAASCSVKESLNEVTGERVKLSFEATINEQGEKSCISATDSSRVLWSPNEKISLFYPDAQGSSYVYKSACFSSTNKDSSRAVTFEGQIIRNQFFSPMEGQQSTPLEYYAVYPYSESNEYKDGSLIFDIKTTQTARHASFSDGEFPAIAKTIDNTLRFYNVCGGICFTVKNENIRSMTLSSLDPLQQNPLAGRAMVQIDSAGHPYIKSWVSGAYSVTLNAPDGGTFSPGVKYYLALAPAVLDSVKIEFFTESTKADTTMIFQKTIKRAAFGFVQNIDDGLKFHVKVQKVEISTKSLELRIGEDTTLTATVSPSDASDKKILWETSNESIATVSKEGTVSAKGAGKCFIFAISNADQSIVDTCELVVKHEVDSVKIKGQVDFEIDEECQFSAIVFPDGTKYNKVKWSSSETAVATVDETGVVKGLTPGRAVIRATSDQCPSCYDEITIEVVAVTHIDENDTHANCYIITAPGVYDFMPVKGNGSTALADVDTAVVMWEYVSIGVTTTKPADIIQSVNVKKGRVRITTPSTLKNGNALVAVKDSEGKVLWSWHIWTQDGYDIDKESILCSNGQYLMGRHLGSVSNQPGANRGLVYQWGRKDPFVSHTRPEAYSTVTWPSAVTSSSTTGTVEYTVANPMTFIKGNNNNDWYYSTDALRKTRWNSSQKTDYDPCPYGWKVPSGGAGGFWDTVMDKSKEHTWNYIGAGIDLQKVMNASSSCWFQCTGYLDQGYVFRAADSLVELWSSDFSKASSGTTAYYFGAFSDGSISKDNTAYCSIAMAVRCVKEQPTK